LQKKSNQTSPATVNRVLELIRALLNRAQKEWGWIETLPVIRMRKIENGRIRWLRRNEVSQLLKELPNFTLMTGLQKSNVTQLKRSNIHLEKKHVLIHADEFKSKRPIPVPLSQQAVIILTD
jgi:integrase